MATQRLSRLHRRILQWLATDHQRTNGVIVRVLSQSCYFESLGVCKPLNSRHPIFGFCPKIELCDRASQVWTTMGQLDWPPKRRSYAMTRCA
jgi:hypothetical protein